MTQAFLKSIHYMTLITTQGHLCSQLCFLLESIQDKNDSKTNSCSSKWPWHIKYLFV